MCSPRECILQFRQDSRTLCDISWLSHGLSVVKSVSCTRSSGMAIRTDAAIWTALSCLLCRSAILSVGGGGEGNRVAQTSGVLGKWKFRVQHVLAFRAIRLRICNQNGNCAHYLTIDRPYRVVVVPQVSSQRVAGTFRKVGFEH